MSGERTSWSAGFLLILLLWPALLLALLLIGGRTWEAAQKPVIRHRVLEYLDERTAQAEYDLAAADGAVRTRNAKIPADGGSVWYETAGFGLVPCSREYGYCYAADGTPRPYPGMEDYDEVPVMFGFRWAEPGGDDGCYVEHIAGGFYYYKAWF